MAESAVFSLASKILSTIASPAFDKVYEKGLSIWEARDELAKLRVTIETIQAMLLDAEKKQESSATVKNLMKRLKGVLYDADDLFDEVATDDMLKQQMMEGNNKLSLKMKVRVSCSKLNPVVSRDSFAKKVKAIRKSLGEISIDMAGMGFVSHAKEEEVPNGMRRRQDPGCFVDAKDVIGRDEDKKVILEMLFNKSVDANPDAPVVIAIVGIGGIGKTTLAQLIYNDDEVKRNFEKRWFACISDISDEKEVLGKILQSICEGSYRDFTVSQLQTKLRELIEGKNFLLVLDDVWDESHDRWLKRMKLLNCGAKGSKIIVTTRSFLVATAIDALETCKLGGLSEDDSWDLFKRLAFAPGTENDPRRIELGREIVKKCANVPLAIRSIGSLLFEKNTIQEWESIKGEELPKLGTRHEDGIMPVLKLSYDHLQSNLKQCFAYCSLFPKDHIIHKRELIWLWISQGYIEQNKEDASHSDFMYLLRRGFFQEVKEDAYGEIESCKMHDLIQDLAQHVAGEESTMLTESSNTSNCARHVSTENSEIVESWAIRTSLLNANRLRSCLLLNGGSPCNPTLLDQVFAKFKWLRALSLVDIGIKNVPNSIAKLKYLRYLNLSRNKFKSLPESMTNLLNLITLDISICYELRALPDDLRKLISLRFLSIDGCPNLKHMPPRMGEMTSLQHLSDFKVGKATSKRSGFDALVGLVQQLRGELRIEFEVGIEDWDGDEGWKLPVCLQGLNIHRYPGMRIPDWGSNGGINNLAHLNLSNCEKVTNLPQLRCLPYLKWLFLYFLLELEFIEDGDSCTTVAGPLFFPRLEWLELETLPKLKGWSRKVAAATSSTSSVLLSFPLLSRLQIAYCPELKSFPLCPRLWKLDFLGMDRNEEIGKLLSNCNSSPASTTPSPSSSSFQHILTSPHLQIICICGCNTLEILHMAPPTLQQLSIESCKRLKKLHIVHPNAIEKLQIFFCPQLELWEAQDKRNCHLDWDSFTNLRDLIINPLPPPEKLPQCLRHRQALGQLQIIDSCLINESGETIAHIQVVFV